MLIEELLSRIQGGLLSFKGAIDENESSLNLLEIGFALLYFS